MRIDALQNFHQTRVFLVPKDETRILYPKVQLEEKKSHGIFSPSISLSLLKQKQLLELTEKDYRIPNPIQPAIILPSKEKIDLKKSIEKSISQAKESIVIFTFTLSDEGIIELLNKKAEEGLKVTVIIDKDHASSIQTLGSKKITIKTRNEGEGRIHHKIAVIDKEIVWIGSANFTTSAFKNQENLMFGFYNKELAKDLHKEAAFS